MIKANVIGAAGISRGAHQSVAGHLAYCLGKSYRDSYYGERKYGAKRTDVVYDELLLPAHAPAELWDYQTFLDAWNDSEKHPRALMAHKYILALPNEVDAAEWIKLIRTFARENFVNQGFPVFYAIHRGLAEEHPKPESIPSAGVRSDNPHAHLLAAFRQVGDRGFLSSKYAGRVTYKRDFLRQLRQSWCNIQNCCYKRHGLNVCVLEGAYRNGQIAGKSTQHIGPYVMRLEAAGIKTKRGDQHRAILAENEALKQELNHELLEECEHDAERGD